VFTLYARELNLDTEQWQVDASAKETKEKVAAAYAEAIRLGLNATPSFMLNGNQVKARSYEQFEELLQRELGATD
jgi:protein-disulfide isomerase